jgi:hypothetical protein
MNNKGQLGLFVMLFIGVIVGLALLNEIFNQQSSLTTKYVTTNDTITINAINSSDRTINTTQQYNLTNRYDVTKWQFIDSCLMSNLVMKNISGNSLTVDTDYVVDLRYGNFTMKNTTATVAINKFGGNNTYITYEYCQDGYNPQGSSRTMASLIGLFVAIALAVFVVVYIKTNY